jgi:small multidrug resistance family-3 protein
LLNSLIAFGVLVAATTLESFGDAVVRIGLFNRSGVAQATTLLGGGILLFGYGALLNFAPVPFERVVGLYIATLFCVWQVVAFATFRTPPSIQVLVGGSLIVAGGLLVTFWQR